MMVTMKNLDEKARAEMYRHFEFFDDDNNGVIDLDEFTDMLKIIGISESSTTAHEHFAKVDTNGNGQVSFEEFIAWWRTGWF